MKVSSIDSSNELVAVVKPCTKLAIKAKLCPIHQYIFNECKFLAVSGRSGGKIVLLGHVLSN